MSEWWDLYTLDEQERPVSTGRIIGSDEPFPKNAYHLVTQAWIRNAAGEYLISQRSRYKGHALYWEMTGGGALMGEDSLQAACREIAEELGLKLPASCGRFLFQGVCRTPKRNDVVQVWLFDGVEVNPASLTVQKEEVNSAMWASKSVIYALRDHGLWIPWRQFDYLEAFLGPREPMEKACREISEAARFMMAHGNKVQGEMILCRKSL